MKPIKFWAETEQETNNFINYLRVIGIEEDMGWTTSDTIKAYQEYGIGWILESSGEVTYYSEKYDFDLDKAKEFFFPIPGDEFVETSELDGQIPKPSKYSNWLVPELDKKSPKHSHYFKDVKHLEYIDVYRTLSLFNVTDPCLQHAAKKLLVAGGRGAGKDIAQDIDEAIDSLLRWKEMREEDTQ